MVVVAEGEAGLQREAQWAIRRAVQTLDREVLPESMRYNLGSYTDHEGRTYVFRLVAELSKA